MGTPPEGGIHASITSGSGFAVLLKGRYRFSGKYIMKKAAFFSDLR
jgi:hypothetical protein